MEDFGLINEFDKDVIYNKMSKLSSDLEEERRKENPNADKERELMFAQLMEGMKLNVLRPTRNLYF